MSWRQQVVIIAAVLEPEQVGTVINPAVGQLVRLGWKKAGKEDLLRPSPAHLLTDNRLNVAQHHEAQRQPSVNTRGNAADVPCPNKQLVASELSFGRVFPQCLNEQLLHCRKHVTP